MKIVEGTETPPEAVTENAVDFKAYYQAVIDEAFGGYRAPAFGQKNVGQHPYQPAGPRFRAEIPNMDMATRVRFNRAVEKKYKDAEDYIADISDREYSNTDPPALRARIEHEHGRLRNEWNQWRQHGLA